MQDTFAQATVPVRVSRSTPWALRIFTAINLILLAVLFMNGMLFNLSGHVPPDHPGVHAASYITGAVQALQWGALYAALELRIHVIAALALFVSAVILLICAIAARRGGWIILSIIGLLGVLWAGYYGLDFLNFGGPTLFSGELSILNYGGQAFSSLMMSAGFLLAAVFYTVGIAVAH